MKKVCVITGGGIKKWGSRRTHLYVTHPIELV
jgi:hypothetical protein